MKACRLAVLLILTVGAALLSSEVADGGTPLSLVLERAFPPTRTVELAALMARDQQRHGRLLKASAMGIGDFPVEGSYNPYAYGLYFTRVKLGTPQKEFAVQIDTGSDILWVACSHCVGCPSSSGLNITLDYFDPLESTTAALVSCSDEKCTSAGQIGLADCSSNSQCIYKFEYGDGSGTTGYYVSDTMYFDTIVADESTVKSSTTVVFGCSSTESGDLMDTQRAVEGIFGFGPNELSVISQLSTKGLAPKVFSHCLKGSDDGGGTLALGEIIEPGIVYTPLVRSKPHYNLNLQSISVNGQTLSIDPSLFATSNNRGTIIDSGTTLAYLAEEAYDTFVNAIAAGASRSVQSYYFEGNQCFLTSNSPNELFPSVSLNFQGDASMALKPDNYLLQQGFIDNAQIWCIAWRKITGQQIVILGDIVLKDKIFVYDLANQRIGWVNFNCSLPLNVSASGKNGVINSGELSEASNSSLQGAIYYKMTPTNIVICLLHIFIAFGLSRQ